MSQPQSSRHDQTSQSENLHFQLYSAKLLKDDIEKQVKLMQHRLNMLDIENRKRDLQIMSRQNRIVKRIEVNNFKHDNIHLQKTFKIKRQNDIESYHQKATTTRNQLKSNIQQQKDTVYSFKKRERDFINTKQKENEVSIYRFKTKSQTGNQQKVLNMKDNLKQTQNNIENYWQRKYQKFDFGREQLIRSYNLTQKKQQTVLENLLKHENIQIQKLQESQQNISKLDSMLTDKEFLYKNIDSISLSSQKKLNYFAR